MGTLQGNWPRSTVDISWRRTVCRLRIPQKELSSGNDESTRDPRQITADTSETGEFFGISANGRNSKDVSNTKARDMNGCLVLLVSFEDTFSVGTELQALRRIPYRF